ncbi:MAG: dienelactone hydrolase family protein [Myxococcales bacterium]|nr:dienelactone hydrolase family protein [Myxococcales bacterium]
MRRALLLPLLLLACGDASAATDAGTDSMTATTAGSETGGETDETDTTGEAPVNYEEPGPHPVGNTRFTLVDPDRGRTLQVEVWYPADATAADAAAQGQPIEDFVDGPDHQRFVDLLPAAADPGTRRQTSSARDAAPAPDGLWPLVAFSHCHGCVRFAKFSVAERLASHGFAVVAPDHQGNTVFDALDDMNAPLNGEFLATRAGDISAVLDAALDPDAAEVPALVRGRFDPARVGVMGHSYGATTAGLVAQDDPRVLAAMPIAAPIENPLLPGPLLADIHVPVFFVLAVEDNSILELGNNILRNNFKIANSPAWLAEVSDAGHWGFSDICGLIPEFAAGCGEGVRQTDGAPFTYLDVDVGRGLVGAYATAFFDAHLRGSDEGAAYLEAAHPEGVVTIKAR